MSRVPRTLALLVAAATGCHGAAPPQRSWWRDAVVYEAFVRSFSDSDGDGVGDLKGLTAHLDDLNDGNPATSTDLGVDALWLMPIFPSPSSHGYDATDYRNVNGRYGTMDDFDALVKAAHQRGIRILLDMVLNHSSSQHPWFQDASAGPTAARRAYYDWSGTDLRWRRPADASDPWYQANGSWYYAFFSPGMPDLNLGNPAVEAELVDAMKFWLGRGVDGFRLDAVRYYFESSTGALTDQPESHAFLKRIRVSLERDFPGVVLVAEAWSNLETEASYAGIGDEAHLAFAFDQADAIKSSLLSGTGDALVNQLGRAEAVFAGKDRTFEAPFLSNHDQVRVMRSLGGDAGSARLAAAALLALPGTPFVYYGEELGMQGGAGGADENKRTPYRFDGQAPGYGFTSGMPWLAVPEAAGVNLAGERADSGSLWNLYRRMIAVRHAQPALRGAEASRPTVSAGGAFALLRSDGKSRVLFLANFGTVALGPFDVAVPGTAVTLDQEGLAGISSANGSITVAGLLPRGFAFVLLN